MSSDQWFTAAEPEKGVWGRFEWFESPDGPYNVEQSLKENRKIPLKRMILRMRTAAGDGETCVPVKPFNQAELVARFPDAWRSFQGEHVEVRGTSLDGLNLDERELLQLKMFGIHSVEMLAQVPDAGCGALGFGWLARRDAAKALLEANRNKALNAVIEDRIADDETKVDLRRGITEALSPKRKPGRPRKAQNAEAVSTAA